MMIIGIAIIVIVFCIVEGSRLRKYIDDFHDDYFKHDNEEL